MKLMEWSREIINSIMSKRKHNDIYSINLVLTPNPLDYDGVDDVKIQIFQTNQKTKETVLCLESKDCFNIKDAKAEIELSVRRSEWV